MALPNACAKALGFNIIALSDYHKGRLFKTVFFKQK